MMREMNEKLNQLKEAGIDVAKMLNYLMTDGEVKICLDNGDIKIYGNDIDEMAKRIKEDGFIPSSKTYRRFVMAQMFEALNYERYQLGQGYNAYINAKPWAYQIDFLIREVNAIIHIGRDRDNETFAEYQRCLSIADIKAICNEIVERYENIYSARFEHLKTVLRHISGVNSPVALADYEDMYELLKRFRNAMPCHGRDCRKVESFKNVFKKIGSYWTCKNLIMHHNCVVTDDDKTYDKYESMKILEEKAKEYFEHNNEGWRMLGFMKKLINDNNFNYAEAKREWEAKKEN